MTHDGCCALVEKSLERGLQTLLYIKKRLDRRVCMGDDLIKGSCSFVGDVLCNINNYGAYLHGMRTMLLQLREWGLLAEKRDKNGLPQPKGDELVFNKAIVDLLMSDAGNCDRFVGHDFEHIMFTDHERDRKGKLVKCRAYFAKRVTRYEEVK